MQETQVEVKVSELLLTGLSRVLYYLQKTDPSAKGKEEALWTCVPPGKHY
jgi:hypothetical protein